MADQSQQPQPQSFPGSQQQQPGAPHPYQQLQHQMRMPADMVAQGMVQQSMPSIPTVPRQGMPPGMAISAQGTPMQGTSNMPSGAIQGQRPGMPAAQMHPGMVQGGGQMPPLQGGKTTQLMRNYPPGSNMSSVNQASAGGTMPPQMMRPDRMELTQNQNNELQKQMNINRQNMSKMIKDEILYFNYTQLPPQLDELYSNLQSGIYKSIYNQSVFGGKRMQKQREPEQSATHQDFLLGEMSNMAIDVQEESLFKKVAAVKLAREAQAALLDRIEKAKLKKQREEEQRAMQIRMEEQAKMEEEMKLRLNEQKQLEVNNPAGGPEESYSFLINREGALNNDDVNMNLVSDVKDQEIQEPKIENQDMQVDEINQVQPFKESLSNLLRNDSVGNQYDNNNEFMDVGEGFFNPVQNDVLNVGVVGDNDFGMGMDNNMMFQSQNPLEPELPLEQNMELPLPEPVIASNDDDNIELIIDTSTAALGNQHVAVKLLPLSRLPVSDVLEDISGFARPSPNLLDQLELFYLLPETTDNTHENDLYEEIDFPPEGVVKLEQGSLKPAKILAIKDDDDFFSGEMEVDEIHQVASQVFDTKLAKFNDILVKDYISKQEIKNYEEQQKDLQALIQKQPPINSELLNIDMFMVADPQRQKEIENAQQIHKEKQQFISQLNNVSAQLNQAKQTQVTAQIEFSFKKREVNVYQPNDLFTLAINHWDRQLKHKKQQEETKQSHHHNYNQMQQVKIEAEHEDEIDQEEDNKKKDEEHDEEYERQKAIQDMRERLEMFLLEDKLRMVRPNDSLNAFSEEDLEYLAEVPDLQNIEFLHVFNKSNLEKQRRIYVSELEQTNDKNKQIQYRQRLQEDHLIAPEKLLRATQYKQEQKMSLNPAKTYDQEQVKQYLNRQYQSKKMLTPIEQSFMQWYISILGDEWRIIADAINFHPFTKGLMREPDELKNFFITFNEIEQYYYHQKISIDPWRSSGLPLLINNRPPSLLNSVQQYCLLHKNNIRAFTKALGSSPQRFKIKLATDQLGRLSLESPGRQQEEAMGAESKDPQDQGVELQQQQEQSQSLLGKRKRSDLSEGKEHSHTVDVKQADQQQQHQQTPPGEEGKDQKKTGSSQSLNQGVADGDRTLSIHQKALGDDQQQRNAHVLREEELKDYMTSKFDVQGRVNSDFQQNLCFNFAPKMSDTDTDMDMQEEELASGAKLSFYGYYEKHHRPDFKRVKFEEEKKSTKKYALTLPPQDLEGHQVQTQIHESKLDQRELNNPMMTALSSKHRASDGAIHTYYQLSLFNKNSMSYWIAYLLKKLYQQDKDQIYKQKLQMSDVEQREHQLKTLLSNRVNKMAAEAAKVQQQKAAGKYIDQQALEAKELETKIQQQLRDFTVENVVPEVNFVQDLWGGSTIYYYDQQSAIAKIVADYDITPDRPPDVLKSIWDRKWETMDHYWFQKHKHLGPNEKKKDPSAKCAEMFGRKTQDPNLTQGGPPYGSTSNGQPMPSGTQGMPGQVDPASQDPNMILRAQQQQALRQQQLAAQAQNAGYPPQPGQGMPSRAMPPQGAQPHPSDPSYSQRQAIASHQPQNYQ